MDGRPTWTDCDEAGDYVVPNVLSPRDLVFRPDNMNETVPHIFWIDRSGHYSADPDQTAPTRSSLFAILSLLAHLSRRLRGELIVHRSSRRPSVCPSVCSHFQT